MLLKLKRFKNRTIRPCRRQKFELGNLFQKAKTD